MASRDHKPPRGGRLNDGFKQRIVGALVLVALAVIFLPTLFDREGARYIDVTSQIPPAPDIQPIEIAAPEPVAGVAPAPAPDEAFQPEVVEQASNANAEKPDVAVNSAAEQSDSAAKGQTPEKDSAPVLDAQGLPVAWVVQVASYREESHAEKLRNRLMDEGYKAYTRSVTTGKGRFVRVFVGPKTSKADALAVKQELDQLLKAQTLVLQFKA
ncbi:SPOR domain-containing protein [Microbulbifer magnicolonia]|uniref:SPOR domain-containing protein n=1 Tax=Microbulbifer magnicolonia TaxID=3109744 RepID=UPI002B414A44|nr:SPOR domain-containing protein [Microbulbifer sp. GG15]